MVLKWGWFETAAAAARRKRWKKKTLEEEKEEEEEEEEVKSRIKGGTLVQKRVSLFCVLGQERS